MKSVNCSPPSDPTLAEQKEALVAGLGRAVLWAKSGKLSHDALLHACLNDLRFDRMIEDLRGDWLWSIMQASNSIAVCRVPIMTALRELHDAQSAGQLCQLGLRYALLGDDEFRSQLRRIVEERPVPDHLGVGEEELIRLEGDAGFLVAARKRGADLATDPWEWEHDWLIDFAVKHLGEDRVRQRLDSTNDADIGRFAERWRIQSQPKSPPSSEQDPRRAHVTRMNAYRMNDVVAAIEDDSQGHWLRGWGMQADESELRRVLELLWKSESPNSLAKIFRIFGRRGLPSVDTRMFAFCNHTDPHLRRAAYHALAATADPAIYQFACRHLEKPITDDLPIGLFAKNFKPGDEHRLLDAICLSADPCILHWQLMSVLGVLEENPEADRSPLALAAYRFSPCDSCRFTAARLLEESGMAPRWLREECRFDSEVDTRNLFADLDE